MVPRAGGSGEPIDVLADLAMLLADLWERGLIVPANIVANHGDVAPQGATGWALLPQMAARTGDLSLADKVEPRLVAIAGFRAPANRRWRGRSAHSWGVRRGRGCCAAACSQADRGIAARRRGCGVALYRADGPGHLGGFVRIRRRSPGVRDQRRARRGVHAPQRATSPRCWRRSERVPFTGLWLEAPERDRISRVMARSGDASDAGIGVVREQSRRSVGELYGWHRMKANRPMEMLVSATRRTSAALSTCR